jgi:hypothetical protein
MLKRFETTGIAKQIAALTELVAAQRVEMARLRAEMQADRVEFQAVRERAALENDALRAELQAERAGFLAALEELKHVNRQLAEMPRESGVRPQHIEHLIKTVDAALVTIALNQARS